MAEKFSKLNKNHKIKAHENQAGQIKRNSHTNMPE